MSSEDRANRQMPRLRSFYLLSVLLMLAAVIFPAGLCAQSSTSTYGSSTSNPSTSGSTSSPAIGPTQVQTSAQNPVFGSVPDAKPTPGVLPLTFSEAIDRA